VDRGCGEAPTRDRPRRATPRLVAALGVISLALYGAWLGVPLSSVEDLRPRPDALEYEEAARNLVDGDGYSLVIEGGRYPPRYPPGFSLLIAPLLYLHDRGPGTGANVVLACALATVWAAWKLGAIGAGASGGIIAAAFVATSPLFVTWSRAVMSDVPSAAATAWILVAVASTLRRRAPPWTWLAIGVSCGSTTLLRETNALVVFPAAAAAVSRGARPRTRAVAWLAVGFALGLLPIAIYDAWRFGSPSKSGYDLYAPGQYFHWRYFFGPPVNGGPGSNLVVYGRALIGWGDLYSWPAAILLALGVGVALCRRGLRTRLASTLLAFVLPVVLLHVSYSWQSTRFLVVLLPALGGLAALPFARAAPVALRSAAFALAVLAAWQVVRGSDAYAPPPPLHEPTTLRQLDAALPANAALLAHATEPFVRRILRRDGTDRVWVPAFPDEHQLAIRVMRIKPESPARDRGAWIRQGLDAHSAEPIVRQLLADGRPVYLSTMLRSQAPTLPGILDVLFRRFRIERVGQPGVPLYSVRSRND
jgi:4-amino-4-deoxy-L-arabinose transferase-like glycosyltransferase